MTDYAGWRWRVTGFICQVRLRKIIAMTAVVFVVVCGLGTASSSLAQTAADDPANQPVARPPAPAWSESQLENLVAPIALYPDALLSQVLVASTYPLEVVEAQQWLQQNGNLQGRELMAAAQQQNWDPSVQALVAFPDVVARSGRNVQWMTDLGNAFLAQQADVMNAVQKLRAEARDSGRLQSTPQFSVNTETQGGQSAIEIQPANPQVIYVPNYDPYAVWGPPAVGVYPSLPYAIGRGFGMFFGTVANLAGLFPGFGGLLGPRSWGWALSWLAQALFVNNSFFSDFGFHGYGGGYRGSSVWVHDAHHRLGVPYGNSWVARRYGGRSLGGGERGAEARRSGEWRAFNVPRGLKPDFNAGVERRSGRPAPPPSRDLRVARDVRTAPGFTQRAGSAGQYGRTFSPESRTADRGFQANRGAESSHSLAARGSFGSERRSSSYSAARMPSERGFSGRGSSERGSSERSSSGHGWFSRGGSSRAESSHMPKEKHFSAPKVSKSHFSKPHGGGHSSGGHGGKRSHRG